MVDLNEDGTEEILAVVVGEYTECDGGDPAVILEQSEQGYQVAGEFCVCPYSGVCERYDD